MRKIYIKPLIQKVALGNSEEILAASTPSLLNDDFDPNEVDDNQKEGNIIWGL